MSDIELSLTVCLVLAVVALIVGVAKTGHPGVGVAVVPVMGMVLPPMESVGQLLLILLVGDVIAVIVYWKKAKRRELLKFIPGVVLGMAIGFVVLLWLNNDTMKPVLGGLVLALLFVELLRRRGVGEDLPHKLVFAIPVGCSAGLATTLGNAAGSIMSTYMVMMGMGKKELVATAAWFFLAVNLTKVPMYLYKDMIGWQNLRIALYCVPLVLLGAWLGRKLLNWLSQKVFDWSILIVAGGASIGLIASWALS